MARSKKNKKSLSNLSSKKSFPLLIFAGVFGLIGLATLIASLAAPKAKTGSLPSPTNLTSQVVGPYQVNLAWTPPDGKVLRYRIHRDGQHISNVWGGATTFVDGGADGISPGPKPSVSYKYEVSAVDRCQLGSSLSNSSSASTPSASNLTDTVRPSVPSGVITSALDPYTIQASWQPSTDNVGVTRYDVFVNGIYRASTATTNVVIEGLGPNVRYSVTVAARDQAANFSGHSQSASGITPELAPTAEEGQIRGKVSNSTGSPINGVKISFTDVCGNQLAWSNSEGAYRTHLLLPGTYNLKYSANGYRSESATVTVTAHQVTAKDIVLRAQ